MQNGNQSDERKGAIAVLVDVRKLAMQCNRLERDLDFERAQRAEREETIARMKREAENGLRYIELGRRETERQKKETISQLAAIVHFTGDRERLRSVERLLADESLDPNEVAALHGRIGEEFRSLYPTQPLSHTPVDWDEFSCFLPDWSEYRIRTRETK